MCFGGAIGGATPPPGSGSPAAPCVLAAVAEAVAGLARLAAPLRPGQPVAGLVAAAAPPKQRPGVGEPAAVGPPAAPAHRLPFRRGPLPRRVAVQSSRIC